MARLSRAHLKAGDIELILPINPYTAQWAYQENTTSYDTIGGRVVQLLSVQIQDLSVTSVAGSRSELQRIANGARAIMEYHVKTSLPASFRVPSRGWDFRVYLKAMPQIGWEVASTTYPYALTLAVEEDVAGLKSKQLERAALTRLAKGIGYQKDFHGGSAGNFQKIVTTVLAASEESGQRGGAGGLAVVNGTGSVDVSGLNGSNTTAEQWGAAVLKALGSPVCKNNLIYFVAWAIKENGFGNYNVLGCTVGGGAPTSDFPSASAGIAGTASFITNGNYASVVRDLQICANPLKTAQDITNSCWCVSNGHCGGCAPYVIPLVQEVTRSYGTYRNHTLNAF